MRKGSRSFRLLFIILLVIAFGNTGCGKKGDPLPPDIKLPLSVKNLKAEKSDQVIILRWNTPEETASLSSIKIQRSETETLNPDCPECPRNYKVIADQLVNDPKLIGVKPGEMSYSDTQIMKGWLYTYRIIVCNKSGYCSEPSDPVDMKY